MRIKDMIGAMQLGKKKQVTVRELSTIWSEQADDGLHAGWVIKMNDDLSAGKNGGSPFGWNTKRKAEYGNIFRRTLVLCVCGFKDRAHAG